MGDLIQIDSPPALEGCGPLLGAAPEAVGGLKQRVFQHVRANGRAARTDIARALDISAGSATTLTAELLGANLLREVEGTPREHTRGRPPVALQVVPDAAHVIGMRLSETRHTAVLTDFAGTVVADAALSISEGERSLSQMIDEISTLIGRVLEKSSLNIDDVHAVGVGLPGIVDHRTGMVTWSALLPGRDTNLRAAFAAAFPMPLYIDNDANVLTLAELWFGAGRSMADFAVVTIENGVGMGLVLNNQLYRGAHGMGLELGHTKVQLDGALCRCGQRGCLEAYLADYALTREAAIALDHASNASKTREQLLDMLFQQAKAGNTSAQTIFRRAGRYLSVGLANVVQLFDPALIILAGDRMQYDYLYADEVLSEMHKLTLSGGRKSCKVAIHAWGDLVWARGASALALSELTDTIISPKMAAQ